jgi:hypothetical protein
MYFIAFLIRYDNNERIQASNELRIDAAGVSKAAGRVQGAAASIRVWTKPDEEGHLSWIWNGFQEESFLFSRIYRS